MSRAQTLVGTTAGVGGSFATIGGRAIARQFWEHWDQSAKLCLPSFDSL